MEISPISNSMDCRRKNNVAFGRFMDTNAQKVVHKKLIEDNKPAWERETDRIYYNFLAEAEYVDIYSTEGRVEAKFNIDKIKDLAAVRGYSEKETNFALDEAKVYETDRSHKRWARNLRRYADIIGASVANIEMAKTEAHQKKVTPEELRLAAEAEEDRMRMHIFERMPW